MDTLWLYLYAYLVASVPSAYIAGKIARGIDIREYGSGNLGVTNVVRHAGRWWFFPLGVFDVLVKGASPVLIGHYILGMEKASLELLIAPLLSIVGHNWSVFTRFQGGRGIAVASGALLALSPLLIGAFLAVFTTGWLITRSAGVWVLLGLAVLPLLVLVTGQPLLIAWFCVALVLLVVIKRLTSNGKPVSAGMAYRQVFFNRLFRDRDVSDREEWVERVPAVSDTK